MNRTMPTHMGAAMRLVKLAMDDFDAQVANPGPVPAGNSGLCDLARGRSPVDGVGHTFSRLDLPNGVNGLQSQPADLAAFVRSHSNREVVALLGVGQGTVTRLKQGYWPADSRKLLAAWEAYKGRTVQRATSWFVRRVGSDGVRHGGRVFGSNRLACRVGELVALARLADGELLAVALELPPERFTLAAVQP